MQVRVRSPLLQGALNKDPLFLLIRWSLFPQLYSVASENSLLHSGEPAKVQSFCNLMTTSGHTRLVHLSLSVLLSNFLGLEWAPDRLN